MSGYLNLEQLMAAVPAHWVWKDDTNTLELVSNTLIVPEPKEKKSTTKVRTHLEPFDQDFEKSKVGITRHSIALLKKALSTVKIQGSALELPQTKTRPSLNVTLEDVKKAAFLLVRGSGSLSVLPLFEQMLRAHHMNKFLMILLNYFSAFLSKHELESKTSNFMTAMEQIEIAEAIAKMDLAQKLLAQIYCRMLLGLGMAEHHHMAYGKAMGLSTRTDRQLYECLYSFCAYVIWVTFGRKSLDVIELELGRLLRSEIFNPAQNVKKEEPKPKGSQEGSRHLQPRRPPINTILNQRSPVLSSLIQTPREKSAYLFKQHRVNPKFQAEMADEKTKVVDLKLELSDNIGIIGEPFSNFFSDTLIPIDSYIENEGVEEPEDEEAELQKSGYSNLTVMDSSLGDMNSQYQFLDLSRATTVGTDSDYNL
ncbi:protein phosphatase 1 regulatory subunit 36 isoform X2 [Stegostoma tigrinum]|uniref:protein phosphatase 1 regulatory subunit 36 isoform X2 n=1 Tax=Stegostoma tigrinum TaxID=3053191 RepID=UPI00286FFE6F|nr:protein phosphatase 1 regulatory subunit 36 isoform X2 [Stegostoma tigrinum]